MKYKKKKGVAENPGKRGEFAGRIRTVLKKKGYISRPQELKVTGGDVYQVLKHMLKTGEIIRDAGGYRYVGRPVVDRLADAIWRAFRYHPQWTLAEIAQAAGARIDTVREQVHKHRKYIEKIGKKGQAGIYRLKDRNIKLRPGKRN